MHPYMGMKAAWIDLEQITRCTGGEPLITNGNDVGLSVNTVHIKDKSNFRGLGPMTGLNAKWHLVKGFSLFSETSLAMAFGLFDVEHKEKFSLQKDQRIRLEVNRHGFTPTIQFQLGVAYQTYFNEDKNHLMLRLSYDSQYWWRVNQTVFVNDTIISTQAVKYSRYAEDASLMGITFDARINF